MRHRFLICAFLLLPMQIPGIAGVASAATPSAPLGATHSAPALLRGMTGTWTVQQTMWPGAGTQAIDLGTAVAERRLVRNTWLEETMQRAPGTPGAGFTRTAFFNYNAITHRYEYASMDTRAPQLMVERSAAMPAAAKQNQADTIMLQGGRFLAPRWGSATNVSFRYRLTISPITDNRQVVRMYLTPLSKPGAKAFLAFQYIYTRTSPIR